MTMLTNPYIAGNPVGNTSSFVGRDDVLREVVRVLRQAEQNAITLYGQRRIGKTSVLQALLKRLPQEGCYRPVYFDLQDKAALPLGRVLAELARTLAAELSGGGTAPLPGLPAPDLGSDPATTFRRDWLPGVLAALPADTCLVLLFDEFDVLADPQSSQAAAAFFPYLRDLLALDRARLQFVFVLGRNPGDLSSIALSIFKGVSSQRVSLLSQKNAERLVRLSEQANGLQWESAAVQAVWQLTRGHPFLTQALCSQVWERAHDESDPSTRFRQAQPTSSGQVPPAPVTAADVAAAVPATLEAGRNTLEWLWDGLGPAERIVASALAQSGPQAVDETGLERILREGGVRLIIRELQNAPQLLQDWDLLEPAEGGYRFRVELLRQWIENNRPLKRVQQEMDRVQPLAENLYNAASAYYQDGELEEAERALKQAVRANPNHMRANELLAELLISQDRLDEARALLEKLHENAPAAARPRLVQVYLAQAATTPDDATRQALFEKALGLDASQPEARAGLDQILAEQERVRQVELQNKEMDYRFLKGREALQRGEWSQARDAFLWIVNIRPTYSYDNQLAADLLAEAVRQGQSPPARWKLWLRQTQNLAFLGGAAFLLLLVFSVSFGQKAFQAAVEQRVGVFGTLAPSLTPTITPTLTPSPTNTIPPTATFTPAAGSTSSAPRADGMAMVYLPAGTFKMGSENGKSEEKPVHEVTLDAFWVDQSEITNAMYKKCVDAKGCQPPTSVYRFGDPAYAAFPVVYVDWNRAKAYCEWAGGALPSEAQWEYAARGGLEQQPYPWGAETPSCDPGAKNGANSSICGKNDAIAVKTFSPNGYELYDMAGNVWEWVNDFYNADYYTNSPTDDPTGPTTATSKHVLRGGSWSYNDVNDLHVSSRYGDGTDSSYSSLGFRCARTP